MTSSTMKQKLSILIAASGLALMTQSASAQQWTMPLVSGVAGGSTLSGNVNGSVGFAGILRGNYSPTNLTGTRTVLGLFGGTTTTNNDVTISGTATSSGPIAGQPSGNLVVRFHEPSRTVWMFRTSVDGLGTLPDPTIPANSTLNYQTFRSFSPSYIYPSLGPISVPVGEAAVRQLSISQTEVFVTTATAGPNGTYTFTGQFPLGLIGSVEVAGTNSVIQSATSAAISGTLTPGAESQPGRLALTLNPSVSQTLPPVPADPANPVPFALPAPSTAVPPPPPANVVLVVGVTGGNVAVTATSNIVASGNRSSLADVGSEGGALGSDGVLDNNDFIVFIGAFFASSPLADVGSEGGAPSGDTFYDNNDFVVFIDAFFRG